jgi:hypothetical protein
MTDMLIPGILLVSVATFAIMVLVFQILRRINRRSEDRYQMLVDQHKRLELLREERQMLREELQLRTQEQQRFLERFEEANQQLGERFKREPRLLTASTQGSDNRDGGLYPQHEYRRLREELERERQEHLKDRQRIKQLKEDDAERLRIEQEAQRLAQEHQRLMTDLGKGHKRSGRRSRSKLSSQSRNVYVCNGNRNY